MAGQVVTLECLCDGVDNVALADLTSRQVHRHVEAFATRDGAAPLSDIAARFVEHECAQRNDKARLFGDRNELGWRNHLTVVLPTSERFETIDTTIGQRDQWLEVRLEVALGECATQTAFQGNAASHSLTH